MKKTVLADVCTNVTGQVRKYEKHVLQCDVHLRYCVAFIIRDVYKLETHYANCRGTLFTESCTLSSNSRTFKFMIIQSLL